MVPPFASFIRRPLLTTSPLSLCLGLSTAVLLSQRLIHTRPVYCDSPSPIARWSSSVSENAHTYTHNAQVPIFLDGWRLNPAAYRQISAGSILGLVGGVAVSMFSRTLAIVFGLTILGVQVSRQETSNQANWQPHALHARKGGNADATNGLAGCSIWRVKGSM